MNSKSVFLALATIGTVMLAATLGISQARAQSCAQVTKALKDGEIAIILMKDPIVSADPAKMLSQILVCSYDGEVKPCNLCNGSVAYCRENAKNYCQGTIDATINSSLGLSLHWSRTTHSPDLCCKQICIDGACKNQCWAC